MKYQKDKIRLIILTVFLSIIFISCENENPRDLCGVWTIDKMTLNNKPFKKFLLVNTISFSCEENTAFLHASLYYKQDSKARWKIKKINGDYNLEIDSSIDLFNDNFKVKIERVSNGQLHLFLKSPKLYISAFKIIED